MKSQGKAKGAALAASILGAILVLAGAGVPLPFGVQPAYGRDNGSCTYEHISGLYAACAQISNTWQCAKEIERDQLGKAPQRAKRSGGKLILQLSSGKTLTIEDTEQLAFNYVEYLSCIDYYLLHVQRYEGTAYRLVSARTGEQYRIQDIPVLSPGRKRFVTASFDLAAGYNPNKIQIWRVDKDTLHLEWSLEPKKWGPSDPVWVNEERLRITKDKLDEQLQFHKIGELILELKQGKWVIVE